MPILCLSVQNVRTCGHVDGKGVEAKLNLRRASSGLRQRCSAAETEGEGTENGPTASATSVEKSRECSPMYSLYSIERPHTDNTTTTAPHSVASGTGNGRPLLLKNAINGAYRHAVSCCLHATPYTLLHARGKYSAALVPDWILCAIAH